MCTNLQTEEDNVDEVVDCITSEIPYIWLPIFLESAELADAPPDDLLHPDDSPSV